MSDLTFYTNPMSRGRMVRWMLEEVGEPYETVIEDFATFGQPDHPYRAINPMMKVPAIVHHGHTVTETAAICAYLADAFPAAGLAPTADERADYYRWMFFTAGPLEAATINAAMGVQVPADRRAMVGYGDLDRVGAAMELAVTAHDYIAGDRFTAADVYVGSYLGWLTGTGMLPSRPAFQPYLGRVMSRPAQIRAREIDGPIPGAPPR